MKPVLAFLACAALLYLVMLPSFTRPGEKAHGLDNAMSSMVYEKDTRTGLCFAYIPPRGMDGSPSITNVPCDKVEKLLQK
jgi:hypothetical protein